MRANQMVSVLIVVLVVMALTGCAALTPWGQISDEGNRVVAIQTAEMQVIVARTDGPEAEARLEKIMAHIREVFVRAREVMTDEKF